MNKASKVRVSLTAKITLVILVLIALAMTVNTVIVIQKVEDNSSKIFANYSTSMADAAVNNYNAAVLGGVVFDESTYLAMLQYVSITDVEGSYAYLVDSDGTMLYHPNADKIGSKVENAAVTQVVADLAAGKEVTSDVVVYDYKGEDKMASYSVTMDKKIVVVTADYDEVMATVYDLRNRMILITVICAIVVALLGSLICIAMLRPVRKITDIINQTAELNFEKNPEVDAIAKRGDELGVIARSLIHMQDSLTNIVMAIGASSQSISDRFNELNKMTENVNEMCTGNSYKTQELASGMEENAATATLINDRLADMRENADYIDGLATDGLKLSEEVHIRAEDLKADTVSAAEAARTMYAGVQVKADEAIKEAESVRRINELTETIKGISSQTSILAINASIEAARAGESGRGFAVVATEVGSLAAETGSAVADIEAMVEQVTAAVNRMQSCLEEATGFIGGEVLDDYQKFTQVSQQYDEDATRFRNSMQNIRTGANTLMTHVNDVGHSINDMAITINESARGITVMAENSADISGEAQNTANTVDNCRDFVKKLDEVVDQFTI